MCENKKALLLKAGLVLISLLFIFSFLSCKTVGHQKDKRLSLPPRKIGVLTAAVVKRNSKTLLPRDFSLVLITKTETLRIHHKLLGDNVWIFFPPKEREELIIAIEEYLKHYKEGFNVNKHKTAYFGKEKIQMVWGLLNVAHKAYPTMRFEYDFLKHDKPYFIIANATIKSEDDDANSPALRIALSPKQCRLLLQLISDDAISSIVQNLKNDFEQYDDFEDEENKENIEGSLDAEATILEDEEVEDFE